MESSNNNTGLSGHAEHYKVLLLDDEQLILFTLSAFFRHSNIEIHAVSSPPEALEQFQKGTYDAIVTDVMMQPIDGFMFRNLIRNLNKNIPIIFLTSLVNGVDNSLLTQIMEDNFSYYVPKNADRNFLLGKLNQVIESYCALNTVRLLEHNIKRSQELARIVQTALLPAWADCTSAYEFSCLYQPLGEISGDLFEWVPLGHNCFLSIFGDVSGHGTHSALGMTAIQSFLKQLSQYGEFKTCHPYLIAKDIHQFIVRHMHTAIYMCGLIAYWDFGENLVRFFNAGYQDLMCYDSLTGAKIELNQEHRGVVPMGMVSDTVFSGEDEVEYHFKDTDTFVVASDGLWDLSRDAAGEESMDMEVLEQLMSILVKDSANTHSVIAFPYHCYDALKQLGYTCPQDDYTMFVLKKPVVRKNEVFYKILPTKEMIDETVQQAADFIMDTFGSPAFATKIELLLEEYLVNIVEHGMDPDAASSTNDLLLLKVTGEENKLTATVWDRSENWKDNKPPMSQQNVDDELQRLNDEYSPRGRGIPIILKIAPQMTRQHFSGLNETVFHIPYSDGAKYPEK